MTGTCAPAVAVPQMECAFQGSVLWHLQCREWPHGRAAPMQLLQHMPPDWRTPSAVRRPRDESWVTLFKCAGCSRTAVMHHSQQGRRFLFLDEGPNLKETPLSTAIEDVLEHVRRAHENHFN